MFTRSMFSFLSFLLCGSSLAAPPETLRLVNVLYRHGDRSPIDVYPLDKNKASEVWPDGLGWLTNIGKMQQYELGKYLKQRYDGFINTSHYNHSEILIQSSGVNRCLMSAYCNLAGLYPPQGDQIWNPDFPWQPIPVQTRPVTTDYILAESAPCPRYDQLMQEVLNSPEMKKQELENKPFYQFVQNNTGIAYESIEEIWQVADTLICERAHNLTWNDWALEKDVWSTLDKLKTESFDIYYYTPEMIKLTGGPLLKEIIDNMDPPGTSLYKFYMYSAHDSTVASLLNAMKVYDLHQPQYRALVIVELHEINNVFEVQVFYKNETDKEPYKLTVPGCASPCTLQSFKAALQDNIPANWTEECKAKNMFSPNSNLSPASWIALIIGVGLCVAVAITIVVMTVRTHRKRSANYSKI